MKNRFTIGEMSKLHNTPIKTLRYYDEIGLFKPIEIDINNRYRYYSIEQFEKLNTINYLKFLGLSLKEIKKHLEMRDVDYFFNLLKRQKEITEHKIKELELIKKRFENRMKEIQEVKNIQELEVVKIKNIEERKILCLNEKICTKAELELSLRKLENTSNIVSTIMIGRVGLTISMDNIKKMKFDQYNSIFILPEENIYHKELMKTLKNGKYACLYYRGGDHNESEKYYKIMLTYLEKNNYTMSGDAIERIIVDKFISKDEKDYLTEIQIPIKKH